MSNQDTNFICVQLTADEHQIHDLADFCYEHDNATLHTTSSNTVFVTIAPSGAGMSTEEYKDHFRQTSNLLGLLKATDPNLVISNVKT